MPSQDVAAGRSASLIIERLCGRLCTAATARLANLSLQTGRFPARFRSAQELLLLKQVELDRSLPANYRPISSLSTVSKMLERLVLAHLRLYLSGSTNLASGSQLTGRGIRPRRRYSTSWTTYTPWPRTRGHPTDWPRPVSSLRCSLTLYTDTAAADRVWRVWNSTFLDSVTPPRSNAVRQAGTATGNSHQARRRSTSEFGTWTLPPSVPAHVLLTTGSGSCITGSS
jgi:hypothetical protein